MIRKENEAQSKRLTIMGDKDIPYRLLRKVMFTGARANFSDVSFAVRQRFEWRGDSARFVPHAGPAVGGRARRRGALPAHHAARAGHCAPSVFIAMPWLPVVQPDRTQPQELPPLLAKLLLEQAPPPPPPPPVVKPKLEADQAARARGGEQEARARKARGAPARTRRPRWP